MTNNVEPKETTEGVIYVEDMTVGNTKKPAPQTPFTDENATWMYWMPIDSTEQGIPDEWVWERLRIRRDHLLSQCDFRVTMDAPWNTAPWISYRQNLRDLPQNTTNPRLAEWPVQP